jgi:hypothetical protein
MTSIARHTTRTLLLCLVLSLSNTFALAGPTEADTPGCVSRVEYSTVQNKVSGYARTERMVQGLFDARGALEVSNPGRKLMFYRTCWAANRSIWVGYKWAYGRLGPGTFGKGWFYEFKSTSL